MLSIQEEQPTELQIQPLSDPEPTPLAAVLTDEEAKAQADASGATDMMLAGYIDDCKTSVENLLATEQVPLVLKYAAEAFLKTIGKYLLHEKEGD